MYNYRPEAPISSDISNGFIHRLDPRTKLSTAFLVVLSVVLTPYWEGWKFLLHGVLVSALIFLAGLSPVYVAKRLVLVVPFIFLLALFAGLFQSGIVVREFSVGPLSFAVTHEGLLKATGLFAKAVLSAGTMIFLLGVSTFPELLRGLELLRAPRVIILTLSFMYRYINIIIEEAQRLSLARGLRSFGSRRLAETSAVGSLVSVLILRSMERSETIYQAMLLRGFEGRMPGLTAYGLGKRDVIWLLCTALALFLLHILFCI